MLCCLVAQSAEQWWCNTKVVGSMPTLLGVFLCANEIYSFSSYPLMVYFIFFSLLFRRGLQRNVMTCTANFLHFTKKLLVFAADALAVDFALIS